MSSSEPNEIQSYENSLNDIAVYYSYKIEEVQDNPNFTFVSYENNLQNGITSGNIYITNREPDTPAVVLPATGGTGTTSYIVVGSCFLAVASLATLHLHRRRRI